MSTFYKLSIFLFAFIMAPVQAANFPDFTELVKEQQHIVVNIATEQKINAHSKKFNVPDFPHMPDAFKDWLKHFDDRIPEHGFGSNSLGSGFLISKDGFILTNYHVIKEASEIIVRLTDQTEKIATVVGIDKRSDVAVLKIEGSNYPYAKIGQPQKLEVGEWVLAIGSPFGFEYSVTAGIVSAKGRSLPQENYVPFIQSDVAINPGNSGGPLFNLKGEVVAVNSQIFSRTGGFMGLSFSIPIDVAMNVVKQIQDKGHVSRGWLGVMIQDVTRELAQSFKMSRPKGALVTKVLPNGPAKSAGFQVGDIIIRYQGKSIERSAMLPPLVGATKLQTQVDVYVIRQGQEKTLTVEIGELPSEAALVASKTTTSEKTHTQDRFGVVISDLTAEHKQNRIVENGVYVHNVNPGPSKEAGILADDIILMVDGVTIKNLKHFYEVAKNIKGGRSIAVLVHRGDGPSFIALKIPK